MHAVNEKVAGPIEAMIAPSLESMGYEIVRVLFTGEGSPTLQIMIERRDGGGMTAEHCAETSRAISAILDVEDPIPGHYDLEVSSPGIDRPLVRRKDFSRFAGQIVKIEAVQAIDGRRRFQGELLGLDGDCVRIEHNRETVALDFDNIRRAKILLTDELIAKAAKLQSVD